MSDERGRERCAAAKLAYEEGNGLVALYIVVQHVIELEDHIQQLEEALRGATDFMRLVLTTETLNQGFADEALSNGLKWLASLEAVLSGEATRTAAELEKEGEDG